MLDEVVRRGQGASALALWIPERLSLMGSEVRLDFAMAIILDRLLAFDLYPDGFEQGEGGRVYRYRREG